MSEARKLHGPPRAILLATDLSARCDRALARAGKLAEDWQAQLLAVHAIERTGHSYVQDLESLLPSWRRSRDPRRVAEAQLRRDLLPLTCNVTAIVERGEPADVIIRAAEARACDLIVTGIARNRVLGRFSLGGTVDRLLRRLRVPLLVVKERARSPYEHIVVASDLSESSRHALHAALALFPGQEIGLFNAYDAPLTGMVNDRMRYEESYRENAIRACAHFLAAEHLSDEQRRSIRTIVENGDAARLIQQFACDRSVDLVALGGHGRSALVEALFGSTAKEIIAWLPCDALIVREQRSRMDGNARKGDRVGLTAAAADRPPGQSHSRGLLQKLRN